MLSHKSSGRKRNELEEQRRSNITELTGTSAKLKRMLMVDEARILRDSADERGTGEDTKRSTAELGSSSGSGWRPNPIYSLEMKSLTRRRGT